MTFSNYQCYYCPFTTYDEDQYVRHGVKNHLYLPIFPGKGDLAKHGLTPQGKPWEKYNITVREAERRLGIWAEKKAGTEIIIQKKNNNDENY